MIVSLPLPLPKLIPDDWNKWWGIWNKYAQPLEKIGVSPNSEAGKHFGFDVYSNGTFQPTYKAPLINLAELYPSLNNQLTNLPFEVYTIRFVMSKGNFLPHVDNFKPTWQVRNMFWCEDPNPQWYYTDLKNTKKEYLRLPEDKNWWAYVDGMVKHGTDYNPGHEKIIVQIFGHPVSIGRYVIKALRESNEGLTL